jgi:hypothetical protein
MVVIATIPKHKHIGGTSQQGDGLIRPKWTAKELQGGNQAAYMVGRWGNGVIARVYTYLK